jgi:cell division protein FtsB
MKTEIEKPDSEYPKRDKKRFGLPLWLSNKYLRAGLGFLVWMLFIDRNDLPTQWKRVKELRTLQQSEQAMDRQISETKKELELLKTNPSTLEKYAREKYMMKRDNEDLYIISPVNQ